MKTTETKKSLILKTLFLAIIMIGCSFYSKENYLNDFQYFVSNIEKEYKNYSDEDWENADVEYHQYVEDYYIQFQDELTSQELKNIGKLKAQYQAVKIKYNANKIIDKVGDGLNQLEGIIEGITESINN